MVDVAPRSGNRRFRLCFVGSNLGRHPGWVTSQAELLTELFRRRGHEVTSTSSRLDPVARLADIMRSLWVWRHRIDVAVVAVFSGGGFRLADAVSLAAARLGLPQVHFLHGGGLPALASRRPAWVRRVLQRAAAIVAPSGYLAEHVGRLGFEIEVIPNVVELEDYPAAVRRSVAPRLLWLRTFNDLYNPRLAVEALLELRAGGIDAELTMAGQDRGHLSPTRDFAHAGGVGDRVRFPGFLDAEGKRREFASHDVFLNTSRVDNAPVTVVEALASGLPIVSTRVGGIPYLLSHEETALLVDSEDAGGMAAAVRRLIDEPSLAERLSRAGRQAAERHDWPRVYDDWTALFERVLGDG